jgi:hypothetical protein
LKRLSVVIGWKRMMVGVKEADSGGRGRGRVNLELWDPTIELFCISNNERFNIFSIPLGRCIEYPPPPIPTCLIKLASTMSHEP